MYDKNKKAKLGALKSILPANNPTIGAVTPIGSLAGLKSKEVSEMKQATGPKKLRKMMK